VGDRPKLPDRVDTLVAGAGPAGLTASLALAGSGADVLLVDAREVIGSPLRCGEVTLEDFFEVVGVDPRPSWIRMRGMRQRFVKRSMVVLDRKVMERELAEIAAERGVTVRAGTAVVGVDEFDGRARRVTLRTADGDQDVLARTVIAADGVSSSVARLAGVDTHLHPDAACSGIAYLVTGARIENEGEGHTARLPEPYPSIPYYFWVIPHGGGGANVGLYVPGRDGARARALLDRMMAESDAIDGGEITEVVVGIIPDAPPLERPFADGLLITGAAARMILPLSAGGIAPAAISGKQAARAVIGLDGEPATAERLTAYREGLEQLYSSIDDKWGLRRELENEKRDLSGG
jgi:digeranylgeranylglycerophospholipid reductase